MVTLNNLHKGQSLTVTEILIDGMGRQRFLDMGIIKDAVIIMKRFAPLGDPIIVEINRFEVAIRRADAAKIVGKVGEKA